MIFNNVYVPTGELNSVNDEFAGGAVNNALRNPGQLGAIIYLNDAEAAVLSNTTTGTLRGGFYQYVKFKSGSTASNAKGQVVVWSDLDAYEVTPDVTAATFGQIAGITLNTVTKGYHGWIQIGGIATVLCKASVTDTTNGDLAVLDQSPTNTVDGLADGTTVTCKIAKTVIGVFLEAPANGAAKLVELTRNPFTNPKK